MSILCNYTLYHNSDYGDQNYSNINYDNHSLINVYTGGIIMPNDFIVRPKCTDKKRRQINHHDHSP